MVRDLKYLLPIAVMILAIGIVIYMQPDSGRVQHMDDSGVTSEKVSEVVNANNKFAFDLYSKYRVKYNERNVFFSPYSISTALAMTYEGARGKTAEEIRSVFHFPEDNSARRSGMARIYNELNKGSNSYELKTANALWAQKDYPFLSEYFNITQNYYGGNVTNLDFMGDSAGARSKINAWAEDQTNGRIKNLLSENPDPTTRLILTNAIYFKGKWLMQFDKSSTREMDFWVSNNTSVKVQMMALSGQKGSYAETEDMQILELPYEGEDLSMLILLPREKSIDRLETSLNAEKLSELKGKLQISKVTVLLPRFRFETAYSMAEDLKELGMPTALGNEADFSGMTGAKDLYIGEVVHKAFVEVNEEGTEAAAATEVGMKTASVEISNSFIADHPFIFIIQQKDTGNILFIGRVINPNE